MINAGTAMGYLDLDTSKFKKGIKSALEDMKTLGDQSSSMSTKLSAVSSAMSTVGKSLTTHVTLPIVGVGAASAKLASDFESKMSEVSAISGAVGKDFDMLNAKAIEMGAKTKFSAGESADAFKYMAMAGWDAAAMVDGISGIMSLAAASGEDLGTTSDIVTDALTAFGLQAKDSAHFADILAKASSRANTNVGLMGETFKYVAPVAGALGYSAEDVAVAVGLMANSGIKGSQAGTALRASLSRLVKPTDTVAAYMEKYGLSLTNADDSMKSFGTVMDDFRSKLGGLSEAEQSQAAAAIFGQEAMSGMLAIINASDSDYKKLTNEIYNATGASEEMAAVMMDNTAGAIEQLTGALESAGIIIGQKLTPYIKKLAEWITTLVEKFNALSDEQIDQIIKWGSIVAAAGPVLLIMSKVVKMVSTSIKVFQTLSKTFTTVKESIALVKAGYTGLAAQMGGMPKLISGIATGFGGALAPILAVVAAIALIVGAFVTLWKTNEDFRNKMLGIWNQIKQAFTDFETQFTEKINALGFNFSGIADMIKEVWVWLCELFAPMFERAFSNIAIIVQSVFDTILGLVDFFIGLFTGDFEKMKKGVEQIFLGIYNAIYDTLGNTVKYIGEFVALVLEKLGFKEAGDKVRNFFTMLSEFISSIPERILEVVNRIIEFFTVTIPNAFNTFVHETIPNFINSVIEWFRNLPYNLGLLIGQMVGHIYNLGVNIKTWVTEELPVIIDSIIAWFASLPERIGEWLTNVLTSIVEWGANMLDKSKQMASDVVNTITKFFSELPSKIMGFINSIPDKIRSIGGKLKQAGKDILNSLFDGIKSVGNKITKWWEDFVGGIGDFVSGIIDGFNKVTGKAEEAKKAAKSVNGSHANGLSYVPFDGYIAELHRGERVLTAQENKEYSSSKPEQQSGGDTYNFYNTQPNPYEYARQMKKAKKELLYGI